MFRTPGSRAIRRTPNRVNSFITQSGRRSSASFIVSPQGRLTLTSGAPVMGASVAGATTLYYSPYGGSMVPIFDGSHIVPVLCPEMSLSTTDATRSPAAVAPNKVYDAFVSRLYGPPILTLGPAWSTATVRGYTLTSVNGVLLNTSAIANGPPALRGTYVGTAASNATSTIDFGFGGTAAGGLAAALNVWNAYNRVNVGAEVIDSAASYTYTSGTIRQAHANLGAGMQVSFVVGLAEDAAAVSYSNWVVPIAVANAFGRIGLGFDSTTTMAYRATAANFSGGLGVSGSGALNVSGIWAMSIGSHILSANEQGDGANANNFNFDGTLGFSAGLNFALRM